VISEAAYKQVKESFNCKLVGEFVLKNKSQPAIIYEVLD